MKKDHSNEYYFDAQTILLKPLNPRFLVLEATWSKKPGHMQATLRQALYAYRVFQKNTTIELLLEGSPIEFQII